MVDTAPSLAKKVEDLIVGASRAYSNGGSREDKYSCSTSKSMDRVHA